MGDKSEYAVNFHTSMPYSTVRMVMKLVNGLQSLVQSATFMLYIIPFQFYKLLIFLNNFIQLHYVKLYLLRLRRSVIDC